MKPRAPSKELKEALAAHKRCRKALADLMKVLENDAFDPKHYAIWQTAKKERDSK